MRKMAELRSVLIDAAAELTGPEHSIVFTNFLPAARPPTVLDRHRKLAQVLERRFVAVVLHCDPDEVVRRVPNADRAARMKLVDADVARSIIASGQTLPTWPELVDLDITGQSAVEVAGRIIALADGD
jgi:hypothetical protein